MPRAFWSMRGNGWWLFHLNQRVFDTWNNTTPDSEGRYYIDRKVRRNTYSPHSDAAMATWHLLHPAGVLQKASGVFLGARKYLSWGKALLTLWVCLHLQLYGWLMSVCTHEGRYGLRMLESWKRCFACLYGVEPTRCGWKCIVKQSQPRGEQSGNAVLLV